MRKQRQKGFTLLELLIVITIIGILASITIVSYPGIVEKAKLAKAIKFSDNVRGSLQPDMVAWWKFDETSGNIAKDTWWNQLDGTVVGATWVEGIKGNALSFDGVNDYVQTSNLSLGSSMTISFWIKSSNYGNKIPISIDGSNYGFGPCIYFACNTINWNIGDGCTGAFSGVSVYPDENWHHFVIVVSNLTNNSKLHIDGKFIGTSLYRNPTVSNGVFRAGSSHSSSYYFPGLIDDVQIYSAALPLSMIQKLYAEGLKTHQNLAKR